MTTTLAIHSETRSLIKPEPRLSVVGGPISIRQAELKDLAFIDALQKKHSKMVGFLFTETLEKKIKAGHVLIAEEANEPRPSGSGVADHAHSPLPHGRGLSGTPIPLGYCIFQDKYDKHDDVGIFYQVNVTPHKQRGLVGAALVKAALDRAAYGCKLACCWCAQDLEANSFWESLGFVPLAFRTGSRPRLKKDGTISKRERIHIFWQRRIREGDDSTQYWYPTETNNGAVKEARIVLPIPPGTHWSDAKPAVLPGMDEALKALAVAEAENTPRPPKSRDLKSRDPKSRDLKSKSAAAVSRPPSRGVWVAPPPPTKEQIAAAKKEKAKQKAPRTRMKNDPKLVAAAREFRDRYLEEVNSGRFLPPSNGKYDISRQLIAAPVMEQMPLLNAA
jgi:hypothetical protein